jgi:trehalose-6-phosphatase
MINRIEKFHYDQGNDCDIQLKNCRVEVRSREVEKGMIRLDFTIYNEKNDVTARFQRFIGE